MRFYDSIQSFNAAHPGANAVGSGDTNGSEADWGYRLRGAGQPGGQAGGWLLVHLRTAEPGWLIAYEIDKSSTKTGRVALLREGWDRATDNHWLEVTQQEAGWDANGRNASGEADLDSVDRVLPGHRL